MTQKQEKAAASAVMCVSENIRPLAVEYVEAMALGDRLKGAGILKRILDAVKNIDPEQLKSMLATFKTIFDLFFPASEPQALNMVALTGDEMRAAGITGAGDLIELITLILAFIRGLRGNA